MIVDNVVRVFEYFPQVNNAIGAGLLIFTRFVGFLHVAPIFSRKELPMMIKMAFALMLTIIFVSLLHPGAPPHGTSLIFSAFLNTAFGMIVGFIASTIFAAIPAAGDMINMQMGLSSAVMFDPSSRSQSSIMERLFSLLGVIIFFNIGGIYWLIAAFQRTFEIFPIYNASFALEKIINMNYLVLLTGNVLFVGLQLAAPALLATLGMDIILGIISKTAPQVNVFQLSFLFKPLLGAWIMIAILPMIVNVISDYFAYFSSIF